MAKKVAIRFRRAAIILMLTPVLSHVYADDVAQDVAKSDILIDIQERIVALTETISEIDARIADELKTLSKNLVELQDEFIKDQNVKMKQVLDRVDRLDAKLTAVRRQFSEENEDSKKSLELQIEKHNIMIREALDGLGQEVKDSESRVLESYQSALSGAVNKIILQSNQTAINERAEILSSFNDVSDRAKNAVVAAIEESRALAESTNQELSQGFAADADKISNRMVKSTVFLACLILAVTGLLVYFKFKERGSNSTLDNSDPSATKDHTDKKDTQVPLEEAEPEPSTEEIATELDHSVAILLAQEVHKMKSRVDSIPDDEKVKKPLQKALERLESGLTDSGYEIINHKGTKYNEGMNIKASFIPTEDENIEEYTIIRVIKPQLNYDGKSISLAEIEVSTRI